MKLVCPPPSVAVAKSEEEVSPTSSPMSLTTSWAFFFIITSWALKLVEVQFVITGPLPITM